MCVQKVMMVLLVNGVAMVQVYMSSIQADFTGIKGEKIQKKKKKKYSHQGTTSN